MRCLRLSLLPLFLLGTPALAASPSVQLILVGDSGTENDMAVQVSASIAARIQPSTHVLALGDLYYVQPPSDAPDCAAQVEARLRKYYGPYADQTIVVSGNHDVMSHTKEPRAYFYHPPARACTADAFAALGWDEPVDRTIKLDVDGLSIDLAIVEDGFYGKAQEPLTHTVSYRDDSDWKLLATHYVWKTTYSKCREHDDLPDRINTSAMKSLDLWLNGHAHIIEAVPVQGRLAITSGGGKELRSYKKIGAFGKLVMDQSKRCAGAPPSYFHYSGEPEQTDSSGGYVVLDLTQDQVNVTPVICTIGQECIAQPTLSCQRRADGPGVDCTQ